MRLVRFGHDGTETEPIGLVDSEHDRVYDPGSVGQELGIEMPTTVPDLFSRPC